MAVILTLGLAFLVYGYFFREKRICAREGRPYAFKTSLNKFYESVFIIYVCVSLFTNLGYFVKIGSYSAGYSFFLSFVLFFLAIIIVFWEGLYDKKIMIIGIFFTVSCLIGLLLAYIYPYKGGYITHISMWDFYVRGEVDKVYSVSPSLTHFNTVFGIFRYSVILSVTKKTLNTRRTWDKLLDIINLLAMCAVVYGFFEIVSSKLFGKSPINYLLNPLFGESEATSALTYRLQGTYKEASHYALYMFLVSIFVMLRILIKKDEMSDKEKIAEYLLLASIALLLIVSTSFSALVMLPLLGVIFLFYVLKIRKPELILCAVAVFSFMMAIMMNFVLMKSLGFERLYSRIEESIKSISAILSGKSRPASGSGSRFISMFEMIKAFAARPVFGVGISVTDAHTTFFSMLACTGVIGVALWIAEIINFSGLYRKNIMFGVIIILSMLFVGGIGFVTLIIYPVIMFYVNIALPDKKKKRFDKVVIEGVSLSKCERITGIERVCREIILRLDKTLATEIPVEYVYIKNAAHVALKPEELKNIKCVELPCSNLRIAQTWTMPRYVRKNRALCVCLPIEFLICKGQISSLYDLRPVLIKGGDTFKFRQSFKRMLIAVKLFSSVIVTDSDYQKEEIKKYFGIVNGEKKVYTVYPGWEHLQGTEADESIFEKHGNIKKGEYFYSLGSIAPHKNFKWVTEAAKRNPDKQFVIAGGKDLSMWKDDISETERQNIIFTGYVSDGESKALMKNCKAFIFPSVYEGFGIPPLEALLCGAKVLCSNATCLPEIYEDTVVYFDPYDYDADIDELLKKPVANPAKIFKKCSWERAAQKWRKIILNEMKAKTGNDSELR